LSIPFHNFFKNLPFFTKLFAFWNFPLVDFAHVISKEFAGFLTHFRPFLTSMMYCTWTTKFRSQNWFLRKPK